MAIKEVLLLIAFPKAALAQPGVDLTSPSLSAAIIHAVALLMLAVVGVILWRCLAGSTGNGNVLSMKDMLKERKRVEEALDRFERVEAIRGSITNAFLIVPDEMAYSEALHAILDATESRHGAMGYIDEDGTLVLPSLTRDVGQECQIQEKTVRFPRSEWGNATWAKCLLEKNPILVNERSTRVPPGHVEILRHMCVPILRKEECIGLLAVANKRTDYADADIKLLEVIARDLAPVLYTRMQRDRERERRLREERVAEVRAFLASSMQSLPQAAVMLDAGGRCIYANPLFEQWVGRPQADFHGKGIEEVSPPLMTAEGVADTAEMVRLRLSAGEPVHGKRVDLLDPAGKRKPIIYSASLIRDEGGRVLGVAVLMREDTPQAA